MPVEVVGGDVEHGGGLADIERAVQLEARQLDGEDVVGLGVAAPPRAAGVPTLPAAAALSPAARRIDSSIWTVVVLPLVPVTASHGAAPRPARSRQASSTSPHTGMPAAPRRRAAGSCGASPGEVTTSSVPAGRPAPCSGPSRTSTSRISRIVRSLAHRVGRVA